MVDFDGSLMKVDLALESAFFLALLRLVGWVLGSLRTPAQSISFVFWLSFWLRLLASLSDFDLRTGRPRRSGSDTLAGHSRFGSVASAPWLQFSGCNSSLSTCRFRLLVSTRWLLLRVECFPCCSGWVTRHLVFFGWSSTGERERWKWAGCGGNGKGRVAARYSTYMGVVKGEERGGSATVWWRWNGIRGGGMEMETVGMRQSLVHILR